MMIQMRKDERNKIQVEQPEKKTLIQEETLKTYIDDDDDDDEEAEDEDEEGGGPGRGLCIFVLTII